MLDLLTGVVCFSKFIHFRLEFRFQHIEYLIGLAALPLIIIVFLWVIRWKRKVIKKIGDERLVKSLIKNYSSQLFVVKFICITLALAAIVIAAANLQRPGSMDNIKRKGVDVVIAMDVSKSMLAQDMKPNRLERARELVYKLMDELKDDRIGLVLFAGHAYLQMPLTTDHGAARIFVQSASPDVVPTQGTVIGEALKMSISAFNSKERKYKSIVLITDGEDHDPEAMQISKQLAENGVIVNTVGIGSVEGSPIIDPATGTYKQDEQGQTVISKLNEQELQQLANDTKGVYVHYQNTADAVKTIINQLNTVQQSTIDDSAFKDYISYFQWFLAAAFLLLLIEFLLPERKWKAA